MTTVWKVAPGKKAENWDICRKSGCIVLGWNDIGDYRQFKSIPSIVAVLQKLHSGRSKGAGSARSILRFADEMKPGDIIVANRGESQIVGIGVLTGDYLHADHPMNPVPIPPPGKWWRRNARLVDWQIVEPIDLQTKYFFVASTVQRLSTEKCNTVRLAYLEKYPRLKPVLDELFGSASSPRATVPSTDSQFADASAIEGIKTEALRLVSKRSRKLRNEALRAAEGRCCVCMRDYDKLLEGRGVRVLQVHHRKQLAARKIPSITKLVDLAVVCANCHMLLHLDPKKAMKVEKLRQLLGNDFK